MNSWVSCIISAYFIHICFDYAEGHVRFVCPRPQTSRSDIFEQWPDHIFHGPCGLGDDMNFEAEYMEVEPGPLTVVFEETAYHRDSPFRISLHEFPRGNNNTNTSSTSSCVLLDQIPHNNEAIVTDHCKSTGYPIGHCDRSKYSITIKIPDIQCQKCYLKLAFIIVDEAQGSTCGGENSTCETYYSCANVRIRPTSAGQHLNITSCGNYLDNLLGPWPKRPWQIYKVSAPAGGTEDLAAGNYDPYMKQLSVDVPLKTGDKKWIQRVEVVTQNENDTVTIFSHNVTEKDIVGDSVVTVWSGLSASQETLLKNNELTLVVTSQDGESNGTLEYAKGYNTLGHYKPLSDQYSRDGWLAGHDFVGSMATFPAAIEPVGTCTHAPHNYVAFLHMYGLKNFHGVVAMSFVDERVHVTAAIHGLKDPIQSVNAIGPELGGAPTLSVKNSTSDSSVLYMVVNASAQTPYLGSIRFLKTVVLRTLDFLVDGTLEQAMQCVLKANNRVHGVGGFQFTKGRWLTFEILIKDPGSNILSVTLDGPATWTANGPIMYDLTEEMTVLTSGQWLVKGTLKDLSSEFLLALWKGWVIATVRTVQGAVISGALSSPGIWYCTQLRGAPCPLVNLLPVDTVFVDEGAEVVPAMGLGAFVLDRADVLQYSILVENLPKKAVGSLIANLIILDSNISLSVKLSPSEERDKAYKSHGILPESTAEVIHALAADRVKLVIQSPKVGKKPFNVSLPTITRELCTGPKDHHVGGVDGWTVGKDIPPIYGLMYDKLIFKYDANDSVYLMETKDSYDNCEFDGSSVVGPTSQNLTVQTFSLSTAAHLYFASKLNCNSTPPLKVMVVSVPGVAPQTADLDECDISLYEIWRKQKLSKFTPPNPMGSAIGGIIAGLILLAIFVVWDRRVNQKKSGNLALFERF